MFLSHGCYSRTPKGFDFDFQWSVDDLFRLSTLTLQSCRMLTPQQRLLQKELVCFTCCYLIACWACYIISHLLAMNKRSNYCGVLYFVCFCLVDYLMQGRSTVGENILLLIYKHIARLSLFNVCSCKTCDHSIIRNIKSTNFFLELVAVINMHVIFVYLLIQTERCHIRRKL